MKKEFKAESKRLLDLMINSIYTHKEIFLRELISNASDAIDKMYYLSLSESTGISREDYYIRITTDNEARTLTISDNGIGMDESELEENLGTIAQSGSLKFKADLDEKEKETENIDIIGQFGVGFYSAFMVADKIEVKTRRFGHDKAYIWVSQGASGYEISETEKEENGTEIKLYLKADTEEEKYSDYLEAHKIQYLISKYSDYVRYPIKMLVEKSRLVEASEEEKQAEDYKPQYEKYEEDKILNSMVPLWKKPKSQITKEEYDDFYMGKFMDFEPPAHVIHTKVEGVVSYDALLYIPASTPFDYYTKEYEKGLALYSSSIMIMDKCQELLPDYFSFVKGLVDSQDLSLNISREILQHDRQLKAIAQRVEKKIKAELLELMEKDREKYEKIYSNFGIQLKFGTYSDFGLHKDAVSDLLLFHSSSENKPVSFAEYISRMKEEQKYIYYVCGESIEKLEKQPQTELIKSKGYEILYCTHEIDEFALKAISSVSGKEFKSISDADLDIFESEQEKEELAKKEEENKDMLAAMKSALEGKVANVIISRKLANHPVCISSSGGLSIEMEKVLNAMPNAAGEKVSAEKVLEINPNHKIFEALKAAYEQGNGKLEKYAKLLYNQALLIEGLSVEDPLEFSDLICEIM
ncbi:MAG: molecular chaperone HtpG [Clostridiales bacterium]|nr:molecular chaperone HtpG [Clostridiales bacterium]